MLLFLCSCTLKLPFHETLKKNSYHSTKFRILEYFRSSMLGFSFHRTATEKEFKRSYKLLLKEINVQISVLINFKSIIK